MSVGPFTPVDAQRAVREVLAQSRPPAPAPPAVESTGTQIRIDQLIDRANDALGKMSKGNPHRWLILQLGQAVVELSKRVEQAEAKDR